MNDQNYRDVFREKTELSIDQLITLYQHMTHDIRVRDNLFIPLSIAIIPAAILAWKNIDLLALTITAFISVILYLFNMLFIFRFTAYQDEVIRMLNKKSNFHEIVSIKKEHYFGEKLLEKRLLFRVRTLRIYLFIFIIIAWVALCIVKYYIGTDIISDEKPPNVYFLRLI